MSGSVSERPAGPGLFVTFEGIEGTGKSTQVDRLAQRLRGAGIAVVATREPGGTELGRQLRSLLLRPATTPMSPVAELLLYATDRAQHLAEVVEPALLRGDVVLCDRYLDATLAYQGHGRRLDTAFILSLHRHAPLDRRPQRTILLDLPPSEALARARERDRKRRATADEGRFEQEHLEFHERVRAGYLHLAATEPGRIRTVDARGEPDEVEQRIAIALGDVLPRAALHGD